VSGKRKYDFNEHYFDEPFCPNKVYMLGLLCTDGTVTIKPRKYLVRLALSGQEDGNYIRDIISPELKSNYPIYEYKPENGEISYILQLSSLYFAKKVISLGCPPKKSLIVKYPSWISDSLDAHFIRGLFDGDGGLCYYYKTFKKTGVKRKSPEVSWKITSTKDMCYTIQGKIHHHLDLHVPVYKDKRHENTYNIVTGGRNKLISIMNWLYKDAGELNLPRKHALFTKIAKKEY